MLPIIKFQTNFTYTSNGKIIKGKDVDLHIVSEMSAWHTVIKRICTYQFIYFISFIMKQLGSCLMRSITESTRIMYQDQLQNPSSFRWNSVITVRQNLQLAWQIIRFIICFRCELNSHNVQRFLIHQIKQYGS